MILDQTKFFTKFLQSIINVITELSILIFISILLIFVNYQIFLQITSSVILFFGFFYFLFKNKIRYLGEKKIKHQIKSLLILRENFSLIREIKLDKNTEFFSGRFETNWDKLLKSEFFFKVFQNLPKYLIEIMIVFIVVLIIALSLENESFTLALLGIYAVSLIRIYPSINQLIVNMNAIRFHLKGVNNVSKNIDLHKKYYENQLNSDEKLFLFEKEIKIKNLNFSYVKGIDVFDNLNITIKKNQINCIKGKSGKGKTTLLYLLLTLLKPDSGNIYIDEVQINKITNSYRKNISYLPQNVEILDLSIRDNITLFEKKKFNQSKYDKVLKISKLDQVIQKLPEGDQTMTGETGNKLSGGQKQRIGLARALYTNPKILFLDEFSSALDKENEKLIMKSLNDLKKTLTIIICSHNSFVIEESDHIIDLDYKNS